MLDILITWAIVAAVALPIATIAAIVRKRKERTREAEYAAMREEYDSRIADGDKVREILKNCFLDLKRQGARGYGPWIAALLDGPDMFFVERDERGRVKVEKEWTGAGADMALEAVRRTIREIAAAPVSYDRDGNEMPRRVVSLGVLNQAKADLEDILGEWD